MKLSLFSISYAGLWGQERLTLPDFIRKASELGFDSVMLAGKRPHLSPLDAASDELDRIRGALAEHHIACDVIAGYTNLTPGPFAEVPLLEMQIAYVESLAQIAEAVGASFVRVFTAYESPGDAPYAVWNTVACTLREMARRVAAHGVTLAIQNHHDVAVHTDAMLELLADVNHPNCRLGFDAWSPALRGESLYDAARRAAPHTVITTNADYVRLPRHRLIPEAINFENVEPDLVRAVKFGCGFIDYGAFFRGLRDGGFDGVATYEMCSQIRGGGSLENLDAFATHYVTWMREHQRRGRSAPTETPEPA